MRRALIVLFWSAALLLALSFIFTIIGSATNHDLLLNSGIIGWFAASCVLFVWLLILILTRTRKYKA